MAWHLLSFGFMGHAGTDHSRLKGDYLAKKQVNVTKNVTKNGHLIDTTMPTYLIINRLALSHCTPSGGRTRTAFWAKGF